MYASLIAAAASAGVPALLDTSGEALLLGAAAGPAIVKPNLAELTAVAGGALPRNGVRDQAAVAAVAAAAGELRRRGAAAVVVTLGADGLLAVTGEGTWLARPPAGDRQSDRRGRRGCGRAGARSVPAPVRGRTGSRRPRRSARPPWRRRRPASSRPPISIARWPASQVCRLGEQ